MLCLSMIDLDQKKVWLWTVVQQGVCQSGLACVALQTVFGCSKALRFLPGAFPGALCSDIWSLQRRVFLKASRFSLQLHLDSSPPPTQYPCCRHSPNRHVSVCVHKVPGRRGASLALDGTCQVQPLHSNPMGLLRCGTQPQGSLHHYPSTRPPNRSIADSQHHSAPPVHIHHQHGLYTDRKRRLWRGPGVGGQVLGRADRAVAGELQDQPAAGPHAAAHCQGLWHSQGRSRHGQHEVWAGYAPQAARTSTC